MRRRFSSMLSGTKLKKYCSLNEPFAPPSADAPLSLMTQHDRVVELAELGR